ncbi:hypothetical protein AGMMS49992_04070 [Clostridia bacterium]|nr:hypothetical protein AGMMS49992_04070 [Clostridia bacterium]
MLLDERGANSEGTAKLVERCSTLGIRIEYASRALQRISSKDNCFAAMEFCKADACDPIMPDRPHVALVQPSDQGNLGSILRSLVGFGLPDLAVIGRAADILDPHVVRASMGALFSMRLGQFASFDEYRVLFPGHALFPFMLDGSVPLPVAASEHPALFSLIFGNEGAGLPPEFAQLGQPVRIPQSNAIDSLNLAVAVSVGVYAFIQGGL